MLLSEVTTGYRVLLIVLFLLPLLSGMLRPLTDSRISAFSVLSSGCWSFIIIGGPGRPCHNALLNAAEDGGGAASLLRRVPVLGEAADGQDILACALLLLLLVIIFSGILNLLMTPVTKRLLMPLSLFLARRLEEPRRLVRRLISAAWELPKALGLVLLLVLNFYVALSANASSAATTALPGHSAGGQQRYSAAHRHETVRPSAADRQHGDKVVDACRRKAGDLIRIISSACRRTRPSVPRPT
jgi:hypothetical protein